VTSDECCTVDCAGALRPTADQSARNRKCLEKITPPDLHLPATISVAIVSMPKNFKACSISDFFHNIHQMTKKKDGKN
jgi:hypothetical protein